MLRALQAASPSRPTRRGCPVTRLRRDRRAPARGHGADRPRLPLLSMSPASIGPVKAMLLALDAARPTVREHVGPLGSVNLRPRRSSRAMDPGLRPGQLTSRFRPQQPMREPGRRWTSIRSPHRNRLPMPCSSVERLTPSRRRHRHGDPQRRAGCRDLRRPVARTGRTRSGRGGHPRLSGRAGQNSRGLEAHARRCRHRFRDAGARRGGAPGGARTAVDSAAQNLRIMLLPEGRGRREERHPRSARRHRRRRGRAVRRRPLPHVCALRRAEGLEGRDHLGERRHGRRLQGSRGRGRRAAASSPG